MFVQHDTLAHSIQFWGMVAYCYSIEGLPFVWKFGLVMALIDWYVKWMSVAI